MGALDAGTGKDAWPNPAPVREPGDDRIYYGHSVISGDYLRFLAPPRATPWPRWRKSSPAPAPPPTPTTPTCATRRIQPPTSNSRTGGEAGVQGRRPVPIPRPQAPAFQAERSAAAQRRATPADAEAPTTLLRCVPFWFCQCDQRSATRKAPACAGSCTWWHTRSPASGTLTSGCSPPSATHRRCRASTTIPS